MIEFALTYSGELRPNGERDHKHALRRALHEQLRHLWENPPKPAPGTLSRVFPDVRDPSFHVRVAGFSFLPVISESGLNVAEVEVTMLRSEPAGSIITRSGDLDNRLKTLFDAMKVPSEVELPDGSAPAESELPFWCVLEDDALITQVTVKTHRLLSPSAGVSDVQLLINVRGRHVSELGIWVSRRGIRENDA